MTKESRRSSVASSSHSSHREELQDVKSEESSGETSMAVPPSSAVVDAMGKDTESNIIDSQAGESQPMTASNSISSKDGNGNDQGLIATYGTRSRNRAGASRPNYAEDKELDTDFEVAPTKESSNRKGKRASESALLTETAKAANGSRKGQNSASETYQPATVHNHYQIPGTSAFSANPIATPSLPTSKKRKSAVQTSSASSQAQLQLPTQIIFQGQTTRKPGGGAYDSTVIQDSNMLSFDKCAGRLQRGILIADDGTKLEVNGERKTMLRRSLPLLTDPIE